MRYGGFGLTLSLLLFTAQLPAQVPTPATGIADITVVNATTDAPVPGARLKLVRGQDEPIYLKADAEGHVVVRNLDLATYSLTVQSPGFLQSRGVAFDLTVPRRTGNIVSRSFSYPVSQIPPPQMTKSTDPDGTIRSVVKVPLLPSAAISGKVTDPSGLPMPGLRVEILTRPQPRPPGMPAGPVSPSGFISSSYANTDDRGEFRATRLEPGSYVVAVDKGSGWPMLWPSNYRVTYYPAALDAESAKPIVLTAGQQARADVQVLHQSGVRVTGKLIRPPEFVAKTTTMLYTNLVLTQPNSAMSSAQAPFTSGEEDFEFKDILPGKYTLSALTRDASTDLSGRNQKPVFGLMKEIEVGTQDVVGFDLALEPLKDLTGSVSFAEGCPATPVTVKLQGFSRLAMGNLEADADSEGKFVIPLVPPGNYTLSLVSAQGLMRSPQPSTATMGARDVLKQGLDVPYKSDDPLKIIVNCSPGRRQ